MRRLDPKGPGVDRGRAVGPRSRAIAGTFVVATCAAFVPVSVVRSSVATSSARDELIDLAEGSSEGLNPRASGTRSAARARRSGRSTTTRPSASADEVNNYYDARLKRANNLARLERLAAVSENFTLFEGDIFDKDFITRVFETEQPRWVLHLAARAGVLPSIEGPFVYIHSNIEPTTRLLELARVHGCEHFAFALRIVVVGLRRLAEVALLRGGRRVQPCQQLLTWFVSARQPAKPGCVLRACACLDDLAQDYFFFEKHIVRGTGSS